jgi:hypothetical protein
VAVSLESFPEAERETADDHNHHEDDERHAKQKAKGVAGSRPVRSSP